MSLQQPDVHTSILAPEMTFHVFSPSPLPRDQVWHLSPRASLRLAQRRGLTNTCLYFGFKNVPFYLCYKGGALLMPRMKDWVETRKENFPALEGVWAVCVRVHSFFGVCMNQESCVRQTTGGFSVFWLFFFPRKCKESTEALWVPLGQAISP